MPEWHTDMIDRLNLRQLRAFHALMITGTTVGAAEGMNVTQPAVSRLIRDLEEEVGVRLFQRTGGRLRPTAEAHWLFDQSADALTRLDELERSLRDLKHLPARPLRIVSTTPVAYGLLPEALRLFRNQHPNAQCSVQIPVRRDIVNWLDTQQFDIAVTTLPVDYPANFVEPLARVEAVCVLPPGHRLTNMRIVGPEDLREEPLITLVPETLARVRLDRILEKAGARRGPVIETQTSASVCMLVAHGAGVSVTDPFTARAFSRLGLTTKPFRPALDFSYGLVFPVNGASSAVCDAFTAIVRRLLRRGGEAKRCGEGTYK
jgi:DNA-binding transcriptional LysR family regulator